MSSWRRARFVVPDGTQSVNWLGRPQQTLGGVVIGDSLSPQEASQKLDQLLALLNPGLNGRIEIGDEIPASDTDGRRSCSAFIGQSGITPLIGGVPNFRL